MKKLVKKFLKSFAHGEKGFTLIELLVVVAILGTLASVAVPSLVTLPARAKETAAKAELTVIQSAMAVMIADQGINTVTPPSNPTNHMAAFPAGPKPLYPDYMRSERSNGLYMCLPDGIVTQTTYP